MSSITFAKYVERARMERRMNKSELARRVGITPQYVTDIEKGHALPSEEVIEQLVGVLSLEEKKAFMLADKIPARILQQAKRDYYGSE